MFKKYSDYLKDNPKGYWFKRKLFGWGWTPVKWQGWLVVLVFIIFLLWNGFSLSGKQDITSTQLTWFYVNIFIAFVILIIICYKTGEKPKWQWGLPNKEKEEEQGKL